MSKTSKTGGKGGGAGDKLQQKSPAEFFAENKNIAGFDNVRDRNCQTLLLHACVLLGVCCCS